MSNQRHIRKRASLKPTSTPLNPLKTRGFGKGIQARNAQLPKSNPLQTRPFGTPSQGLSQQQETRSIEEQMEGTAQFGYNAANIQNHAPETSQRPVQRKEGTLGGWNLPPIQRVDPVMNRLNMWREEQPAQVKVGESDISEQEAAEEKEETSSVQTKLTVGEPGDKYEQEADAVAANVVEQINPPVSHQRFQGKVEPKTKPTVMGDGGARPAIQREWQGPGGEILSDSEYEEQFGPSSQIGWTQTSANELQSELEGEHNWSTASPEMIPMESWNVQAEFIDSNRQWYNVSHLKEIIAEKTFENDWNKLQETWNAVVEQDNEIKPFDPSTHTFGLEGHFENTSISDLITAPSVKNFDRGYGQDGKGDFNGYQEVLKPLKDARNKIPDAERAIGTAFNTVKTASISLETAILQFDVQKLVNEGQAEEANLARLQANKQEALDGVNAVKDIAGGIAKAITSPKDMAEGIINAIGGVGTLAVNTVYERKLDESREKIAVINNKIGNLRLQIAQNSIDQAVIGVENALIVVEGAIETYKETVSEYQSQYEIVANWIRENGGKDANEQAEAFVVIPKLEQLIADISSIQTLMIKLPEYSPNSGVGASFCLNVYEFDSHYGGLLAYNSMLEHYKPQYQATLDNAKSEFNL